MKLITRKTDYAVRALAFIAQKNGESASASELTEKLKLPRPFLRGLLQVLNKKKLLVSNKGKGGGFKLARPPEKIFLSDLIQAFHGPIKFGNCFIKKGLCQDARTCILKKKLDALEKLLDNEFKTITIKSLCMDI